MSRVEDRVDEAGGVEGHNAGAQPFGNIAVPDSL